MLEKYTGYISLTLDDNERHVADISWYLAIGGFFNAMYLSK